jgi:uncharacterized protein YcgL (UPF0745 family)
MYLFVDRARQFEDLPEALLTRFGEPQPVMLLQLAPGKKLARTDAEQVLAAIDEQGFYLQMPPGPEDLRRRDDRS